jgi:hypothetical protein
MALSQKNQGRLKRMSESQSLKRPRFFSGKLITPEDLELTQQYFREKLKRHNRSLHGFGIVSGLKVTVHSGQIIVESGLALDCEGNELVVGTTQFIVPPATTGDWHTAYVNVRFVEESNTPVPTTEAEEASTANVTEGFELAVAPENCNRGHRHLRARWLACGQPHALTIAKLRHSAHGWRVDRGYRAPTTK